MSSVEVFGLFSVSVMLLSYSLEQRSHKWVLVFALSCFASSLYAGLIGSIPFCIVEGIWGIVAVARWRGRTRGGVTD
jgi:hypothetical protein